VNAQAGKQPVLRFYSDPPPFGSRYIGVHNLDPDLLVALGKYTQTGSFLQSMLRVRVTAGGTPPGEEVPHVLGRYQILPDQIRFIPHFPFAPGVPYRATFDPRALGHPEFTEVVTLEFSLPDDRNPAPTEVIQVFPSSDSLPENLLRFYIRFSNSMQRGRAEEQIRLLGPDGRPAPDAMYRPPVELWDRSMRYLTILLDPGRLKRGVRPNRELGPPLKPGYGYTLAIGSGMLDLSGQPLRESVYKRFLVTEAVRERIAVEHWKVLPPSANSRGALSVMFPKPLDWALLWHTIHVASANGHPIIGRVAIDQGERRWSFTPASPWAAAAYSIRIASHLEDVCGNSLEEAFDRPLRSASDLARQTANHSIPFYLEK
jgi:hypothetical protein